MSKNKNDTLFTKPLYISLLLLWIFLKYGLHSDDKSSFEIFLPAPYGDYEVFQSTNWTVKGPVFAVSSDLDVSSLDELEPFLMHRGLSLLQELGEPFGTKKIKDISKKIMVSSGNVLFSSGNSGLYFKTHETGLLAKAKTQSTKGALALRCKGNILIHAGQKISTDNQKSKIKKSTFENIQSGEEITLNGERKYINICGKLCLCERISLKPNTTVQKDDFCIYCAPQGRYHSHYICPQGLDFEGQGHALRFRIKNAQDSGFIVEQMMGKGTSAERVPLLIIDGKNGNMVLGDARHPVIFQSQTLEAKAFKGTPVRGMILPFQTHVIEYFYQNGRYDEKATRPIPAGWAICNGQNGTPNLENFFIKGGDTAKTLKKINEDISAKNSSPQEFHKHTFPKRTVPFKFNLTHPGGVFGKTYSTTTGRASGGSINPNKLCGFEYTEAESGKGLWDKKFWGTLATSRGPAAMKMQAVYSYAAAKTSHTHKFPAMDVAIPDITNEISTSIEMDEAETTNTTREYPPHAEITYIMKL